MNFKIFYFFIIPIVISCSKTKAFENGNKLEMTSDKYTMFDDNNIKRVEYYLNKDSLVLFDEKSQKINDYQIKMKFIEIDSTIGNPPVKSKKNLEVKIEFPNKNFFDSERFFVGCIKDEYGNMISVNKKDSCMLDFSYTYEHHKAYTFIVLVSGEEEIVVNTLIERKLHDISILKEVKVIFDPQSFSKS